MSYVNNVIPKSLFPTNINTDYVVTPNGVPLEIWREIFNLTFQTLKSLTENKVNTKMPLDVDEGTHLQIIRDVNEYSHLPVMGDMLFFSDKNDFLKVVRSVYNLARCCKVFYQLTQKERRLIKEAVLLKRTEGSFSSSTFHFKPPKEREFLPLPIPKLKELSPYVSQERENEFSKHMKVMLLMLEIFAIQDQPKIEIKPLVLEDIFSKELKLEMNLEKKQSTDSDKNKKCLIQ